MISQAAPKEIKPAYKPINIYDKIKNCIRQVESSEESEKEWCFLKKVYEKLSRKRHLNNKERKVLEKLEDLMIKYGKHDHDDSVSLDAQYMNRGDKDA